MAKPARSKAIDVDGKTVVLTGTFSNLERKDAEKQLAAKGARVTGSVSKQTDMVFAAADAGSKKATAESLGIAVYGEAELFALIGTPAAKLTKPKPKPTAAAKQKVAERASDDSPGLAGKTVVITGTLSQPRAAFEKALKAAGARVTGSVSANTHYLISGADAGANKVSAAMALGVPILDEAAVDKMLAG